MADTPLTVYRVIEHEALAIRWFYDLHTSGDMQLVFAPDMRLLSNFLHFFATNGTLAYSADEKGIWFVVWFVPHMSGAMWGVWVRKDRRHGTSYFKMLAGALNEAFKFFNVIVGECKQESLHEIHLKLGFKHCGTIPAIWEGNDVNYYALTKDGWLNRKANRKREQA